MTWQLQEAKNKLSAVIESSHHQGPQIISQRGKNTAVLVSYEEYQKLVKPKKDLKSLLKNSGLSQLDLSRDKTTELHATPSEFDA